jgi:intracellular multiplication protein IcmB
MSKILDPILDTIDGILAWLGTAVGQLAETYCELETADSKHALVARDGSLVSIFRLQGATFLVGPDEFDRMHKGLTQALQTCLSRAGHVIQVYFSHDKESVKRDLEFILAPARQTAKRLNMNLDDLFNERVAELYRYCASETLYMVVWTRPSGMTKAQTDQSVKDRIARDKAGKIPLIRNAQNFMQAIPELRDTHDSLVRTLVSEFNGFGLLTLLLDVHDACRAIRESVDPEFTDPRWQPYLPGDRIPIRETRNFSGDVSDVLWPRLANQLIPRDGEVLDLRSARIGDRVYSAISIDLFPKELASFSTLFNRALQAHVPWRISFLIQSGGLKSLGLKPTVAAILSFAHAHNKLIGNAVEQLRYLEVNTDDAIVKMQVMASTWAPVGEEKKLRLRSAELAKAIQGWGFCETSEVSGDAYAGVMSSALGIASYSVATASVAPLSDVCYLLPFTRPASPWQTGAVLFRSTDGKPWPYQPGSTQQTTWIDLIYARPGSGKSVLSNAMNLALCLSGGLQRLPHIAVVDIGPSSSGLISLIKESLPPDKQHLAAYHRMRMVPEMSINPFDTQLGCRYPSPQERAFVVNFLTLLATPVGQGNAYDGITDMAGMIVDELYKALADTGTPRLYTPNLESKIDKLIAELNITLDSKTTWWEITDSLFSHGKTHEAGLAQRYASPLLADATSICRSQTVEDLYGQIKAPTGEPLISAFARMISSAIREYPILARITAFDLGEARVVSLDLDEVAKTGGEAADRQTAIMYMLARYILARHYYLTEDILKDLPPLYQEHHKKRILEIREDPKRIVFDEFHRTSKAKAVRDQVIVDMREGRKWRVQVALLSQSLDDFDPVMIEFATSVFIMDAGPKQAIDHSVKVFGLSDTAKLALETRVHGPRAGGATFIAQFSTKTGVNTQLVTSTIGPIELWAFNTTAEDARIRNALYERIGAVEARKLLAMMFPNGSAAKVVEERMGRLKEQGDLITDERGMSIINELIEEIYQVYKSNSLLKQNKVT